MADCICGHKREHHFQNGTCSINNNMVNCNCKEFREDSGTHATLSQHEQAKRILDGLMTPKAALNELRPTGLCPRCHNEHLLDPLGIAVHCIAVQQVSFNADGGIGHIEFVIEPPPPVQVMHVSGVSADAFNHFALELDRITKRLTRLENIATANAGEPLCRCGHGLGEHTGDGCKQCSCRSLQTY